MMMNVMPVSCVNVTSGFRMLYVPPRDKLTFIIKASASGKRKFHLYATQLTLTRDCAFIILGCSVKPILFDDTFHSNYCGKKGMKVHGQKNGLGAPMRARDKAPPLQEPRPPFMGRR